MRKTVVVPLLDPQVDHVGISERALPYARAMADTNDADVLLVSVVDVAPGSGEGKAETGRGRDALATEREQYLGNVARSFPEDRVLTRVLFGSASAEVFELLPSLDRPMLVMGSHARTGTARMLYGSVAFQLLHGAEIPVLVVRRSVPQPAHPELHRILVPLDGSIFGEQVLATVLETLGQQKLELHLLHVIDLARNPPDDPIRTHGLTPYQWAKHYLPRTAEVLADRGHQVSWEIRDGSVPDEIVAASHERMTDLISMATNSRGGLSRLIYGSVAEKVLSEASVPLLLVRPEESAAGFSA